MTVEAGDREIVPMRWVIVGSSGPDPTHATFNARSETVETSSLWRVPFQFRKRRCLVPVPAYVEWRKPEREPFRFELVDQQIVALPGLWDVWRNPADCTWLQSCSVLTTFANTVARPVHARLAYFPYAAYSPTALYVYSYSSANCLLPCSVRLLPGLSIPSLN